MAEDEKLSIQEQLIIDLFSGRILPTIIREKLDWHSHPLMVEQLNGILFKFESNLRKKIINTFMSYFTSRFPIYIYNEFWEYIEYEKFWWTVGKFHDSVYSRTMDMEEVKLYFDKELLPGSKVIAEIIDVLGTGEINPSDFGVTINKYSKTLATNLFRDSFPKFNSNLRSKCTDIFVRYFFNDDTYPINDLWKFVDYKDFWVQLRNFHDYIYSKKMILNDVIIFFEKNLAKIKNQKDSSNRSKGDDFSMPSIIRGDPPDSPASMPRKLKSKKRDEEEL